MTKTDKAARRREYKRRPDQRLNKIRERAKKRGIEFSLTLEDLPPIGTHCPVLGIEYYAVEGDYNYLPSIDRIDNSKGYVKGNVEWISYRANSLKSDATIEEMRLMAKYYLNP